jgi:hypothetical protein
MEAADIDQLIDDLNQRLVGTGYSARRPYKRARIVHVDRNCAERRRTGQLVSIDLGDAGRVVMHWPRRDQGAYSKLAGAWKGQGWRERLAADVAKVIADNLTDSGGGTP